MSFCVCGFGKKKKKEEKAEPSRVTMPQVFRQKIKIDQEVKALDPKPFVDLLSVSPIDHQALKKLAWKGVPHPLRGRVYRLLLHIQPGTEGLGVVEGKRKQYLRLRGMYEGQQLSEQEAKIKRIITGDVKRTCPENPVHREEEVQKALSRLLLVWHFRHPASGYIQGISDIVTPFLLAFLGERGEDHQTVSRRLSQEEWAEVEADIYWCLDKVLQEFQENYMRNFKGIQLAYTSVVKLLRELDTTLYLHLEREKVDFFCVTLRELTTLLIRAFNSRLLCRLFDTYLSIEDQFPPFVIYLLVALYLKFSDQMLELREERLMNFLVNLPSKFYSQPELELVISEAYAYSCCYPLH